MMPRIIKAESLARVHAHTQLVYKIKSMIKEKTISVYSVDIMIPDKLMLSFFTT